MFPVDRSRRLRQSPAMRRLVSETHLVPAQLVLPVFVREGIAKPVAISSMPGVFQHTLETLPAVIEDAAQAGIGGVMLFAIPERRDAVGSAALDPSGILNQAIEVAVRVAKGRLVIQSDLCLDEFTDHGHCGLLDSAGQVDNDSTLEVYQQMALAQAKAGAELLGLSGMMDGQVAAIRTALDDEGYQNTALLAYTAKYASAFYGPFREAVDSQLQGDRKSYQINPANRREGVRKTELDLAEGADIVMVKPAMSYLDVLSEISSFSPVPVWAYQVSGEYAMLEAAAANGWLDRERVILESLLSIRRAGAEVILTYYALEAAAWLR